MQVLMWLIPISIVLLTIAGTAFVWAVSNNQFDDLDRHGLDVLDDSTQSE